MSKLISPAELAKRLSSKETKIFDATWYLPTPANVGKNAYDNYMKKRIPGALYFDIDAVNTPSKFPHMLPSPQTFENEAFRTHNTMHRTYSLRNSRAPTAAQLASPPPPTSSTKSGRFFGNGSIVHSFRRSAAGSMGPDLARKLAQLVKMEKNVMRSIEQQARERREVAKQLSLWGEDADEDVSDVTDKLGVLIYEIGELEDQFIDKYDQYRITLKSVRNIEASVQPSRDRKQKITDQIAHLKYKEPNSPKIIVLEQELVRAEAESLVAEAQLSNITREKVKAAFNYQFDAIREHSEKLALIAGYGKALLELLDDTPVTPGESRPAYDGYEASKQVIIDAENALASWTLDQASVKPTLSIRRADVDDYDDEEEEGAEWAEDEPSAVVEEGKVLDA